MKQELLQVVIFYYVVDSMSFSKAAQRIDLSKSYVSNQITLLEKRIRYKLLERNTRRIKLTFAGEQFFIHCKNIIREYHQAEQTLTALHNIPEGRLRVTAPAGYANNVLAKQIPAFLEQYPKIQLELILTGEKIDLMEEKIDVAIRLTHEPPEDRIAKRIGQFQMQICATSDYLQKYSEPKTPQELIEHPTLVYAVEEFSERWLFLTDNQETIVDVIPRLSCNHEKTIIQALLQGKGIARLPSYIIEEVSMEKPLQLLLQEYALPDTPIYAVYSQTVTISPMVRAFIEFVTIHQIS